MVFASDHVLYSVWANVLLLLFFLPQFLSGYFEFSSYLLLVSIHLGAFLMSVAALYLSVKYLKTESRGSLILLFIIAFLTTISDMLFVVAFTIPLILTLIIFIRKYNKKALILILINVSAVVLAMLVFRLIKNNSLFSIGSPHRIMDFNNIINSWYMLCGHIKFYFEQIALVQYLIIICIISFIAQIISLCLNLFRAKNNDLQSFMNLFVVFFAVIVFFAPVINGNYTNVDTLRYNAYAFYLLAPSLVFSFNSKMLHNLFNNKVRYTSMSLLIALILSLTIAGIKTFNHSGLTKYFNYYPEKVREIDEAFEKYNLKSGIANYWTARYVTLFSKNQVNIVPVYDNLAPCDINSNKNWFYGDDKMFNFIVLDNRIPNEVYKGVLDSVIHIIECSNFKIIVFPVFRFDRNTHLPYFSDINAEIK